MLFAARVSALRLRRSMSTATTEERPPLVMQLIVDGVEASALGWHKGIWMAQAAHASIAAIQCSRNSVNTQEYVSAQNMASMRKLVLQTTPGKKHMTLQQLSMQLLEARQRFEQGDGVEGEEFPTHWLWIEEPEGIPTCLAIAPNRKPAELKRILRTCTLFKDKV